MEEIAASQTDPKVSALNQELRPGERIAWKSLQYPRLTGLSMSIYLFAIPWTAFALFWTGTAWVMTRHASGMTDAMSLAFPLFGLPFILIGVGMMLIPLLRYVAAKRTILAITNERIIRLYKGKGVISESVPANRIGKITLRIGKKGRDTLEIKLKGVAEEFEATGNRFIMRDIEHAKIAKKFLKDLSELAKN